MEVKVFNLHEGHRNDFEELLSQLSGKKRAVSMAKNQGVHNVGAFDGNKLVGFAQIFILPKTTSTLAHLEDVVVHRDYRSHGLGRKLVAEAVAVAKRSGAESLSLTSRPERVAARELYQSMGFVRPETTVFRMKLDK